MWLQTQCSSAMAAYSMLVERSGAGTAYCIICTGFWKEGGKHAIAFAYWNRLMIALTFDVEKKGENSTVVVQRDMTNVRNWKTDTCQEEKFPILIRKRAPYLFYFVCKISQIQSTSWLTERLCSLVELHVAFKQFCRHGEVAWGSCPSHVYHFEALVWSWQKCGFHAESQMFCRKI